MVFGRDGTSEKPGATASGHCRVSQRMRNDLRLFSLAHLASTGLCPNDHLPGSGAPVGAIMRDDPSWTGRLGLSPESFTGGETISWSGCRCGSSRFEFSGQRSNALNNIIHFDVVPIGPQNCSDPVRKNPLLLESTPQT